MVKQTHLVKAIAIAKVYYSDSIHFFSSDMKQQPDVLRYLKDLDTLKLLELGGELGLNPFELDKVPSQQLARKLSIWWIQKEYYVKERSGTPTWSSLAKALRQVGANGIADKIERDAGGLL